MKKRVADVIVDVLAENGIDICFSVVGGGAMHLNNAFLLAKDRIRTIYNHHEQACAMAAEGYARLTGNVAAVCVTSGPGGTNTINGVQGAWVDSLPMVVVAGYPRYETTAASTGLDIRTRGVQENDIISQVRPITKYAKLLLDPLAVRAELQTAICLARTGRRGPVWLSVPLDIQNTMVEEGELYPAEGPTPLPSPSEEQIREMERLLREAKRPCILTGSGIRTGNSIALYRKFAGRVQIPVVGGAQQADINCNGDERFYGMSGSIGPRCGNFILQSADVILVLGNSMGTNQTGFNVEGFAPNAKIIMVDAQADEAKKPGLRIHMLIHSDLGLFFEKCLRMGVEARAEAGWFAHCDKVYRRFSRHEALFDMEKQGELTPDRRIPVLLFWKRFLDRAPEDTVIALGNSSCVHGVLQFGIEKPGQRVLVNYNCGSMGHDLPQSIGAAVGAKRSVYCVAGDGSIMMNLQELQTIVFRKLPIKIILFNNHGYGAIRNTCRNFFDGANAGCDPESGVGFPDFEKVAAAFGLPFHRSGCIGELDSGLDWLEAQEGPCLLEICQKIGEVDSPKVASRLDPETGKFVTPPVHDMSPFLPKEEIEQYLL